MACANDVGAQEVVGVEQDEDAGWVTGTEGLRGGYGPIGVYTSPFSPRAAQEPRGWVGVWRCGGAV